MSRIGKKEIIIPAKTTVTVSGSFVVVKGPLGELKKEIPAGVKIDIKDSKINISIAETTIELNSLWGTIASHITNMIKGVNKPYEKKLIVEGIGFKGDVSGTKLVFRLGFSHPVEVQIPKELKVTSEKGIITISGINKDLVGSFSAGIRALKKPEPYKGKGIRYSDEVIRRKEGKKTA